MSKTFNKNMINLIIGGSDFVLGLILLVLDFICLQEVKSKLLCIFLPLPILVISLFISMLGILILTSTLKEILNGTDTILPKVHWYKTSILIQILSYFLSITLIIIVMILLNQNI